MADPFSLASTSMSVPFLLAVAVALVSAGPPSAQGLDPACRMELGRLCPGHFGHPALALSESECIKGNIAAGQFSDSCQRMLEAYERNKSPLEIPNVLPAAPPVSDQNMPGADGQESGQLQVVGFSPLQAMGIIGPMDHSPLSALMNAPKNVEPRKARNAQCGFHFRLHRLQGPFFMQIARLCGSDLERRCVVAGYEGDCFQCLQDNMEQLNPACRAVVAFGGIWRRVSGTYGGFFSPQSNIGGPQSLKVMPVDLPIFRLGKHQFAIYWHSPHDYIGGHTSVALVMVAGWLLLFYAFRNNNPVPSVRRSNIAASIKGRPAVFKV